MNNITQVTLILFSTLTIASCGSTQGDSSGGGNVGFGGAQDIGQFRSILDSGGIPGSSTLDANGFFNEHFTELPDADCGQTLCTYAMLSVGRDWVTGEHQAVMQVSMKTPIDPASLPRMPLNMVVVVDTSGSMSTDNRLVFVKQGLDILIDQMQEGDRLGIVEYNSNVVVKADLADGLDKETLKAQVAGLVAGGSTNIYGGLERGFEMIANNFDIERQNRVMFLSDGLATAGNTDTAAIIVMAEGFIGDGVGLTTIGVGSSFNVSLMRGLAERGAGNFYFLESAAAIDEVFTDELDFFVTPIALDLRLEVTPGAPYQLGEVIGTRLWKTEGDRGRVEIPAAFVSSRTSTEPGTGRRGGGSAIFIRMLPNPDATADIERVAEVTLSYRLPGETERVTQTVSVTNPHQPGETPEATWTSHTAMEKNYAIYNIFMGLREATHEAVTDYSCSLATLEALREDSAIWNELRLDEDISADIAIIDLFAANLREAGAYSEDAAQACEQGWTPNPDQEPYPYDNNYRGCSSGGSTPGSGFALLLMAGAFVLVRRRRGC